MEKKADFKSMTKKSKIQYIWDYYRWPILIAICVIAFIISIVHHYVTYQESVLDVILVNVYDPYSEERPGFDDFLIQEGYDPANDIITADTTITFSMSDDGFSTDVYSNQNMTLKMAVGGNDIVFAPDSVYMDYAAQGSMLDLRQLLTEEELTQFSDILIYTTDTDSGETYPCGVTVDPANEWMQTYGYYHEPCDLGIIVNNDAPELAKDFLLYVLNYKN